MVYFVDVGEADWAGKGVVSAERVKADQGK